MAIPDTLAKFVISGTTCSGAEKFATGFWVHGFTSGTFPDDSSLAIAVATAPWTGFSTGATPLLTATSSFTAVDAYFYMGGVATLHAHAAYVHAGTGSIGLPPQCAVVMTLRTANATRSGRGRMYLPFTASTLCTSTGQIGGTFLTAAVNGTAGLLSTYATGALTPVVVSQTNTSFSTITSVDADNVVDTQRRRRNKLTGARTAHSVP